MNSSIKTKTAMDSGTCFKHIVGHKGPFRTSDPEYKGSRYNVLVEWENGEITSEPLNIFGKDNPVTCAVYAREHGLLGEEGWKQLKGIVKREKKMLRMVNQSRIKATRNAPRYKFGYRIPHNYNEAMQFDLKNGNTLWREATDLEMLQLAEYDSYLQRPGPQGHCTTSDRIQEDPYPSCL
jgi:hypothetical protein